MRSTTLATILALCTGCAQWAPMTQGGGLTATQPGGAGAPGSPTDPAAPAAGAKSPQNPTSGAGTTSTSGPKTVSVTVRSSCSRSVPVFYGDEPKFGSGTRSTVSSNSVSNRTFEPGDVMWVTDEKEEGLGSVTVTDATREIEIGSDCRSIRAR